MIAAIVSALRWALYAAIGVLATCILIIVVLIGGNNLHLWGGQAATMHVELVRGR
jgi:hypothetical protein